MMQRNRYADFMKRSPKQLQAVTYSIIMLSEKGEKLFTGEIYECYKAVCQKYRMRSCTQRAVVDWIAELELYGFITCRVISK